MTKDNSESAFPASWNWAGGLSKREYAAIHLCVPDSGNPELDAMINRARRDRFAAAALQGALAHASGEDPHKSPGMALTLADAMMKESDND